jgi:hypothetical protein
VHPARSWPAAPRRNKCARHGVQEGARRNDARSVALVPSGRSFCGQVACLAGKGDYQLSESVAVPAARTPDSSSRLHTVGCASFDLAVFECMLKISQRWAQEGPSTTKFRQRVRYALSATCRERCVLLSHHLKCRVFFVDAVMSHSSDVPPGGKRQCRNVVIALGSSGADRRSPSRLCM